MKKKVYTPAEIYEILLIEDLILTSFGNDGFDGDWEDENASKN